MAKNEAEHSCGLSIFWLKKYGYLPQGGVWRWGGIQWTYGVSEHKSSINFTVKTGAENNGGEGDHIRLSYTHTSRESGEKEDIEYKVPLATTPCNYGGVRYWFLCPLFKNGRYCGKRVGVLYNTGKYFGCRHCGEIAYAAQMKGGRFRGSSYSVPDMERLEKEIKRYYYNGKPTRKYRRLMEIDEKLTNDLLSFAAQLDERYSRFTNRFK
jgi:hypothetical protein